MTEEEKKKEKDWSGRILVVGYIRDAAAFFVCFLELALPRNMLKSVTQFPHVFICGSRDVLVLVTASTADILT